MHPTFSIVIPTLNGVKTIGPLLERIGKIISNYTSEIIIIDSGSTDGTVKEVKRFRDRLNIRIISIPKKEFNHGETRNRGARLARGEFVCYFSQDVLPKGGEMFRHYLEDFKADPDVVAVFGENIPYPDASYLERIEHECRWDRLNKYLNNRGFIVQTLKKPFVPYTESNYFIWYFFGNTASCFKKKFLLEHPFAPVAYGEDVIMGKQIIELGLAKVYDTRCSIFHSHTYSFSEYYARQKASFQLRYAVLDLKEKGRFVCKIRKIIKAKMGAGTKIYILLKLFFLYGVKLWIYLQLWVNKNHEHNRIQTQNK